RPERPRRPGANVSQGPDRPGGGRPGAARARRRGRVARPDRLARTRAASNRRQPDRHGRASGPPPDQARRGPALFRGLGGVSLAGAARSALLVARHPDDSDLRLLVHTKSNFGPLGPTLGFRIVDNAVRWEGPIDLWADELGAVPDAERT